MMHGQKNIKLIRGDYREDAGIICTFRLIIIDLHSTSHLW